jgi:hypothetical protein
MGKREVKPVVPKMEPSSNEKNGNADKEESTDDKNMSDNPVKEEEDVENTEEEVKVEVMTEDKEKDETENTKKEEAKRSEESEVVEPTPAETAVIETKPQFIEVEEYFVKYRNFSYLHCEWRTEEELYKGDKRIQAKLKRFKQKQQQNTNIFENVCLISFIYDTICEIYINNIIVYKNITKNSDYIFCIILFFFFIFEFLFLFFFRPKMILSTQTLSKLIEF